MRELRMVNGRVVGSDYNPFEGMHLQCTRCDEETLPEWREDEPKTVIRCASCGKKHNTDSLGV